MGGAIAAIIRNVILNLSRLTELECAVLGVVWRIGPCSAYAVKKAFEPATSSWSSSPGSIYPLLKRLEAAGLVAARQEAWGRRGKALYSVTPAGFGSLQRWVIEIPDWAGATPADPIRNRTFFLDALEAGARVDFVAQATAATLSAIDDLNQAIRQREPDEEGPYGDLALAGALLQQRAKLRWLAMVRRRLDEET